MDLAKALHLFETLCLSNIDQLSVFPEALEAAGFKETSRIISDAADAVSRVLFQHPHLPFAFSCLIRTSGLVSDGSVILPKTAQVRAELETFINRQPNLKDTTEEIRPYFAYAPEDVSWSLVDSQFWSSKAFGAPGINFTLGPSLIPLPSGPPALALTASHNPALEDPLTQDILAELTGPGSKLAKFVLIFSEIATKACPDLDQLIWAAEAFGYKGDVAPGETSFRLSGGHGTSPRSEDITSSIQVNCESDYAFEFGLGFILGSRLSEDTIRDALFAHLGVSDSLQPDGSARITLAGETYILRLHVVSALFGNYYFLMQR